MEKREIENKGEKLMKSLNKQMIVSGKILKDALELAAEFEKEILKTMTPKEIEKKKAFDIKIESLLKEGKLKEAQELKKQYLNE